MKNFEFTPLEWEIIQHRLEAPDGLYEAVIEHNANPMLRALSRNDVYRITQELIKEGPWVTLRTRAEYEIFKDAIEGSVFIPLARAANAGRGNTPQGSEISHSKYMHYCNAAARIEKKTGWEIPRN